MFVLGTPGEVHIWSYETALPSPSSRHTIALRTRGFSNGSIYFAPISGIIYNSRYDTLIISLADGSFHLVFHLSTGPVLGNPDSQEDFVSGSLTAHARLAFARLEEGGVGRVDVNRIDGMVSYDGGSTYVWMHE